MSPSWRPDDSFLNLEGGKLKGVTRVKDALNRHGVKSGRRIVTSRDKGQDAVHRDLVRTRVPKGFQQWQLPVALGPDQNILAFMTHGAPDAVLPSHSHDVDLFRIVVSGSVRYKDQELTAGDWMVVPSGIAYQLTAGPVGVLICHWYWRIGGSAEGNAPAQRSRAGWRPSRIAKRP